MTALRCFVTEGHAWPSLISLEVPGNPFQLHSSISITTLRRKTD